MSGYEYITDAPMPRGYKGGSGGGVVRNSDEQENGSHTVMWISDEPIDDTGSDSE